MVQETTRHDREPAWAETRIRTLTRLYQTLSEINKVIVRAGTRDELFQGLCRAAVAKGEFAMAWVGLVDEAARKVVPVHHDGDDKGHLSDIQVSIDDVPSGRGPVGTSIRMNRVDYVTDLPSDARAVHFREIASDCGFRAAAAVPFRLNGKVVGALALYAARPDIFDAEQLELLEGLSGDISFALDTLEIRARRDHAESRLLQREAELLRSQSHLTRAQRIGMIGSIEHDLRTNQSAWSAQMYEILGLEPATTRPSFEAFLGAIHPGDRTLALARRDSLSRGIAVGPAEYRIVRPDGEIRWGHARTEIIDASDGEPRMVLSTYQDITDRKQVEAELREREQGFLRQYQQLAVAQKMGRMGSAEVDLRTLRVQWSDELFRLFGLDPRTARPSPELALAAVHPEDRDRVAELIRRNRAGEDLGPCEYRVVGADGTIHWHYCTTEFLRDKNGVPLTLLSTVQDVTDTKAMEESLRAGREDLALAQKVGHIGSATVDGATGKVEWSDEFYVILGLDPANGTALEAYLAAVHPDDRERARERVQRVWAGRDVAPQEFRFVKPGGEIVWVYVQTHVQRASDGTWIRSISTVQDVTDRKRREEELHRSRTHLAQAQRVGHVGSIEVDLPSGTSHWSDEMYALLGLEPGGATSFERFLAMVHPDDRGAMTADRDALMRSEALPPREYRFLRPDGTIRWMLRQVEVLRDAAGRPASHISTYLDITDLKRAQQERDEFERQLMQSQKMEAIGKLTGGIAHDFNNLLSVILGRLRMVEEQLADRAELRDWVRTCVNAANRGTTLTRSMLAYSRQQPLQPVALDAAAIIADIMNLLPRTLGEAIDVKVEVAGDLWRCLADPGQLQNALLNLALNARDAMPDGGKLMIAAGNSRFESDASARPFEIPPGDYVALSVSDTGTGMPREIVEKAFEPFFTTKEPGKGTGLGLSMVYGFAKQSGGNVKISSELGRGTSVRLFLPRSLELRGAEEEAGRTIPASGGTEAILVVEDDAGVREWTVAVLAKLGYRTREAADAGGALEQLARHAEIALVLTDLTLPGGVSGRALAERALAARPGLEIVFMSGYAREPIALERGPGSAAYLLQKPFSQEELARTLRSALERAPTA